MHLSVFFLVFAVIFIAELPDKSMFASLALSTRYRKSYVWMGVAAAFLAHVIIAIVAGHFLTLLPKKPLKIVIGLLFLIGSLLLLFGKDEDESEEAAKLDKHAKQVKIEPSFKKVFLTSFVIVFVGEWGDITQIATANYAAKYHNVLSVGLGALLGLWSVAAVGIFLGHKLLDKVPARSLQRATAVILLIFAFLSLYAGFK